MMKGLQDYIKKLFRSEETPDETLENIDLAEELLKLILVEEGFSIPIKDKNKYVMVSDKAVYYPPENYYGKTLTSSAFIDMMRKHRIVPITIGNVHLFVTWERAKEDFGYALLWKHLFETYQIVLTSEDGAKEE